MKPLLAALALILTPALAVAQCPCHANGAACHCPPGQCPTNCPPQGLAAAPTAYRAAGYDSRLVQAQPGVRIVLACAPALRIDVVQQPPILQIRVDQPRTYVVETPVFFEAPVVYRSYVPAYVPPPTIRSYRIVAPPVTYTRTRQVTRCVGSF